jgi:hypothetical protein
LIARAWNAWTIKENADALKRFLIRDLSRDPGQEHEGASSGSSCGGAKAREVLARFDARAQH